MEVLGMICEHCKGGHHELCRRGTWCDCLHRTPPMRVYIAGPMTGIENGNKDAFLTKAKELQLEGYIPVNPWDIVPEKHIGPCIGGTPANETGHRYGCNLRADIMILMFCDAITVLPGWEQSMGASTEVHVARSIGLKFIGPEAQKAEQAALNRTGEGSTPSGASVSDPEEWKEILKGVDI